jgi:glycosyltransferase involved in cell wall biosynthesis
LRSAVARRRLDGEPEAVLHVGAWALLPARVRASYHDGNLAVSLARGEPLLDPRSRSVRRTLEADRRFYERMNVLLPMSDWLRRSFVEDFGQDPAKVVTVGAGANLHELPEVPGRTFEQPRFLFVGKQWERKGGPQLLEAFRHVHAERPDAELWIVGPEQPIAGPGLRFFGRISRSSPDGERRLGELYSDATAFAMPSVYEPFGIVFLEAMAYGLPCIASDRCAMPEIVADGMSGFTVDAHDVDALGQRLLELTDPERAQAFGEAGRRRLEERFTWDGVAARIVEAVASRTGR